VRICAVGVPPFHAQRWTKGRTDGRIVGSDKNCTRFSYRLCESAWNESDLYLRVHNLKEKCRFESLKCNDCWNLLAWPVTRLTTTLLAHVSDARSRNVPAEIMFMWFNMQTKLVVKDAFKDYIIEGKSSA
jgi:hypothetical protein